MRHEPNSRLSPVGLENKLEARESARARSGSRALPNYLICRIMMDIW
jgi:hypothetical protein